MAAGVRSKRADVMSAFAGQGTGAITAIRPAAGVLRDLVAGAEATLENTSSFI
jgi:hypothetical protein